MENIYPIKLEVIHPFSYHSVYEPNGTGTISKFISDKTIIFTLSAALGFKSNVPYQGKADYKNHINESPFRTSLFHSKQSSLLHPIVRRCNLYDEGGYSGNVQKNTSSGNFKDFFYIQEVNVGSEYNGCIVSNINPFELAETDNICIRIGNGRKGIVSLSIDNSIENVYLNSHTGLLFDRKLELDEYILYNMQSSNQMNLNDAHKELKEWVF